MKMNKENLTSNNLNTKTLSNSNKTNHSDSSKHRYVRKQTSQIQIPNNQNLNRKISLTDSILSFTDSSIILSENKDDKNNPNLKSIIKTKIGFQKNSKSPPDQSSIDPSIKKWSNKFNSSSLNSLSIHLNPIEANTKKISFKQSIETNHLVDIIERENTNFSVKISYDNPFSSREDALSPHTYLDLDIDPKLRLARENTIKNLQLETNRKFRNSPDIYYTLNTTPRLNLYSELKVLDIEKNKKKTFVLRPIAHQNVNRNKQNSNNHQHKENTTFQSTELVENDLVNSVVLDSKSDKNYFSTNKNDIYSSNQLSQTSSSALDQLENVSTKSKLINENKLYQKAVDLSLIDGLVVSMQQKESFNEIPYSAKKATKNNKNKAKTTLKKSMLKEFKYCILTDLKIGEGEFSETFQGYRYDLGQPVKIAAKRLKFTKEKDEQNVQNLLSEISVLSQLGKHHYVIDFLGVFRLDSTYLVFEYCDKGDLKKLLDICRKTGKREALMNNLYKLRIAYEVASGMEYISSLEIVHKDLAARNILLDRDFTCKIADFGCCKAEFLSKMPIRWMAPESLNKLLFTTATDVWSYGVLLWEIFTYGITPYPGMTDDEVIGRINQWYRLYKPQDCPNEVYAIMLSCWKDYHKARPRFFNIKNKFRDLYKQTSDSLYPNNI